MNEQLLRLNEVLKIIPVSKSSWYQKVKDGIYPKPVKLGARTVAWKKSEIMNLVEKGL